MARLLQVVVVSVLLTLLMHIVPAVGFGLRSNRQLSDWTATALAPANTPCSGHRKQLTESLSRRPLITSILCFLLTSALAPLPAAPAETTTKSWTLGNGNVELPIPLTLVLPNQELQDPVLLGSGGGGAVFAMTTATSSSNQQKVALKVSWESSAASVANECRILDILQANQVSGVEQCLGSAPYPGSSTQRIMIALQPVVEDEVVNSISELKSASLQALAVQQVVQSLVQMLKANVVTTDVQFLLSQQTGQLLFIDMTEAQALSQPPTFLQLALSNSFVSEMMALIPEKLESVASKAMDQELKALGDLLQPQAREILREQVPFLSQESIDLLEKR